MYLFSMDNPFFRFVGKVTDLVWINILTLICCIPVFTAGAAFSAMYSVLIKMALKEENVITRPFFREFKANFKNATKVWIPSLVVLVIMAMNAYLIYAGVLNMYPQLLIAAGVAIGIIVVVIVMFLTYYFAMLARFENTVGQYVKNSILMVIAYFPRSLCMIFILLFPFALMRLSLYFLLFWGLYGISFPGYVNSMLLGRIFINTQAANE